MKDFVLKPGNKGNVTQSYSLSLQFRTVAVVTSLWEAFANELNVVLRRQEWLIAVKDSNEQALQDLQRLDPALDSQSTGGSRDGGALGRAGPCPGYEKLQTFAVFREHALKYGKCQSVDDLKSTTQQITPLKKLLVVLLGSCKTAVAELRAAKQRSVNAEIAAKKKKEKEEAAQQKKRASATKAGRPAKGMGGLAEHPIFKLEGEARLAVPTSRQTWPDSAELDTQMPFLVTQWDVVGQKLDKPLSDFGRAFNESSLKVCSRNEVSSCP